MTSYLSAELAATCNALGFFDAKTNSYYADENTLETAKDLIRYLRRDDETHDIRRQLGESKVLQTDLIPLIKNYWEQIELFDVILRLLVNLTTPALVLWNEVIPNERSARNHYLQIEEHLQGYKEAFNDENIWAVLTKRISKILELDVAERGDENSLIIERILILIRNVLYVPYGDTEKRTDNDASVHDQVLWALHQSGMLDIILFIAGNSSEQAYYMHILEILSYLLREQTASELARAALQRSQTEKIKDEAELLSIRHTEMNQRQQKTKMYSGSRHSRFGGTFVVKSMKSISNNELIYHKPLNKLDALNFDADKKKLKTPKNKLPVHYQSAERRSAFSIRLFLKNFCVEFLNGAYNNLMYYVKSNLVRNKAQVNDESYYLWAVRFFMEFNRFHNFNVKFISETMSIQTFHYVQQQMERYFDMMQSDKANLKLWSRRLHLALLTYKELLSTIACMDKSANNTVKDSAKVIKTNLFYTLEYRELVLTLLITYDELKLSDKYLVDLIETQHIFIKMLESFCSKHGSIVVQEKARRSKKKKTTKSSSNTDTVKAHLQNVWDEIASELSTVLEHNADIPSDVVPFDATSDVPVDDQKSEAMCNIQRHLKDGNYEKAIGLLRAARDVWPENDSFGSSNMAPEEEFLALRDIFLANLGVESNNETVDDEQNEEDEDDEEDEQPYERVTQIKFEDFSKRLTHPKIVRACGLALKNFETNSINTNHCIAKLLHRIAFDCKMYVMLFQLSIFRTFQKIFKFKDLPHYKELCKFSTFVIRKYFKLAQTNKKVFMETLFWKSNREAYDIEQGYDAYDEQSKITNRVWTVENEEELRQLFIEYQEKEITEDVVDWICENLIDNTRSRRMVLKKLKELGLLTSYKSSKPKGASRPQSWGAEEETRLRELFLEFKDANDPMTCIMDKMEIHLPKNRIIEKLLVMGLIQDKSEVKKKRTAKNTTRKSNKGRKHSENTNEDLSDDEETPQFGNQQNHNIKKKNDNKKKQKMKGQRRNCYSKTELLKTLLQVKNSGMGESLQWLKESFEDAIEDYEDDGECEEGIPLVPIMEHTVTAMENPDFKKLLKMFNITEPFDEQESFWRISAAITVENLKEYIEQLSYTEETLEEMLSNKENESPGDENTESNDCVMNFEKTDNNNQDDSDSDSDDVFDKLRQLREQKSTDNVVGHTSVLVSNDVADNQDDSNSNDVFDELKRMRVQKSTLINVEVDYEEPSNENNEILKQTAKKNRRIIDSDSDESSNEANKKGKKTRKISNSDTDLPVPKRSRIIDSDDESN